MKAGDKKLVERALIDGIATCHNLERKFQQALDMLAGGGKPANSRKAKVNTVELILKRRQKIYANVNN